MTLRWPATALLLAGCHDPCPPLSEVPILGESAADDALVRAELERMDDAIELEVCVPAVRWVDSRRYDGAYNGLTHRVRLRTGLSAHRVPSTTRHELCHAAERQHELVYGPGDVFDQRLWEVPDHGAYPARLENFAIRCELGPESLRALWPSTCPHDELPMDREIAIRDRLFDGPAIADARWTVSLLGGMTLASSFGTVEAQGASLVLEPSGLVFRPDEGWIAPRATEAFDPAPCEVAVPEGWLLDEARCSASGAAAALADVGFAGRLLLRAPDGTWAGADHCLGERSELAVTDDGRLWLVEADGLDLSWYQIAFSAGR